jgi:putative ABC transport system permease protein
MPSTTARGWSRAGSGRRPSRRRSAPRASGLKIGDRFVGSHGLAAGGPVHADRPYTVVGVLAPTASVLDRLVLTPIESVWEVHGMRNPFLSGHEHEPEADQQAPLGRPAEVRPLEVTALLIHYNSPLGAVEVPLEVNREGGLQAASPALETARLLSLVGVGLDTLRGFGLLLIASAGLSVFIALWNAMQERRYDLAVMRTLGASRRVLFVQPLIEGLILAGGGAILGLLIGHGVATIVGGLLRQAQDMGLTGLTWRPEEFYVLLLALGVGLVSAVLPAIQAYRTDIAQVLASRA